MAILAPTVSTSAQMPHYGIRVNIDNPASTPEADHNLIERYNSFESVWEQIGTTAPDTNFVDYGAAKGTLYDYRVIAVATDGTTATSTTVSASVTDFVEWQLKDPDTISDSIEVDIANDRLDWSSEEVQASFNTIGGKYPLVVKDDQIKADKWDAIFEFMSTADKEAFEKLRHKQKVLLLQAPFQGIQWYFVFGSNGRWVLLNPHTPWWRFTCEVIEVGRP